MPSSNSALELNCCLCRQVLTTYPKRLQIGLRSKERDGQRLCSCQFGSMDWSIILLKYIINIKYLTRVRVGLRSGE